MLNKLVFIFIVIMLSGCVLNPSQRSGHSTQYQEPAYSLTNKRDIKTVQQRLKNRGFDPRGVDGVYGKNTKKAIRKFQQKMGYPVDGLATTRLLKQLEPGFVEPTNGQKPRYDNSVVGQSTAEAAVVCGAVGAVGGGIAGGKDTAIIAGTASAAACALADMAANWFRIDQAEKEQNLNLSIEQVRKENKSLRDMINTAKKLIKDDMAKINRIKQQLTNKELSNRNAKKQFEQLDKSRGLLRDTYNRLLAKKKERQDYANSNNTSQDMNSEMNKLNNEIALLKTQLDELDQLRSISAMG